VALSFSAVVFLATAPIVAYLIDWIGLPIAPIAVLCVATLAACGVFILMHRASRSDPADTIGFAAIACAIFIWLLRLAGTPYLPPGSGPDLVHHLTLIDFIERTWRLPHDPNLAAVIGEMANYTPGAHLLAALAGAWTRTDGFHTIYPIIAFSVAIKAGLIFLIARRLLREDLPRSLLAVAAVLLLFGPRDYFIGSFTDASYYAQIASEMFVIAMWLAIVLWSAQPSALAAALAGICGAAAFVTWPVALGPALVAAAVVVALHSELAMARRIRHQAMIIVPAALLAAIHAKGRIGAAAIVAGAGYVEYPRLAMFGWWFVVPAAAGLGVALRDRRSRSVAIFAAAIALQMAALFVLATRSGAARPYQALKTVYLAIYPLAVAGSLALGCAASIATRWIGKAPRTTAAVVSAALVVILAAAAVRSVERLPRRKPAVSQQLFEAGVWARTNLKPECVDYVVDDPYTAYWLHIGVLRNARAAPRSTDDDTYVTEKEQVRWVEPAGLPYAIVQDFDALPRDIRQNVDVVRRFGRAAVIRRRGPGTCAQ